MLVEVIANKRDSSRRLAFIKAETVRFGKVRIPAYFSADDPYELGEMNVMISGVLSKKDEKGYLKLDEIPNNLFIRKPTKEDDFVEFDGFECSGSMCQTTAQAKTYLGDRFTITPGKLMPHLVVADNVNAHFNKRPEYPLKAGRGYVKKGPKGLYRLEGLADLDSLSFMHETRHDGFPDKCPSCNQRWRSSFCSYGGIANMEMLKEDGKVTNRAHCFQCDEVSEIKGFVL